MDRFIFLWNDCFLLLVRADIRQFVWQRYNINYSGNSMAALRLLKAKQCRHRMVICMWFGVILKSQRARSLMTCVVVLRRGVIFIRQALVGDGQVSSSATIWRYECTSYQDPTDASENAFFATLPCIHSFSKSVLCCELVKENFTGNQTHRAIQSCHLASKLWEKQSLFFFKVISL